ncbi:MAG: AAA family ATPase [Pseudobacteriovorax sp.]|nr:AAA family ATPase [Pseudobacteriovorax sp.]
METRIIITGTPGTGKTSLITELSKRGFSTVAEPTRKVLKEQLEKNGPALPSKDPYLFVKTMLDFSLQEYQRYADSLDMIFFDRGIPDLIAYAQRFGVDTEVFVRAATSYRYQNKVFILDPWEAIFVNDDERRLSFDMALAFHDQIVSSYKLVNYELISVPKNSVEERADFVLSKTKKL